MRAEDAPESGGDELVTLADAAARLGLTLPRLQRLLKRPEFAPYVRKAERQTRTGTRTVTLVSVSVLSALRTATDEQKREQYGPNRYRSEGKTGGGQADALTQAVFSQMEARLRDKDAEIDRLTRQLDEANQRTRLTLEALAREQTLRALPPYAQDAPQGPQASETGTGGQSAGGRGEGGSEGETRARAWWQVWRPKGRD